MEVAGEMDRASNQKHDDNDGSVPSSTPVTTANPDDEDSAKEKKKRKQMMIPRLENDKYHLQCEWGECQTLSTQMETFTSHVSGHIMDYFAHVAHPIASSGMCFTCGWRDCGAQILGSVIDFNRHVYFHVFHVRLKCLGAHMARVLGLGTCMLGSQSCNWIPELPENLQCAWDNCKIIFDNPYIFYSHVLHHSEEFPEGRDHICQCLWQGCSKSVRSKHKMKDHLRSHTQEKQVACPTCGGLFVSHTKLMDHILRQANSETQRYECSHCNRRFATERMLREHMRRHVNHYKCPLCDMTVPCPSALKNHIRYKHSEEKPFKCGHCKFSAKSSYDLRKHLDSHNVEDQFTCHIANCPFSARSYSSLDLHFKKHHQDVDVTAARYMCHVCNRVFVRGYSLTFHLKKKHLFQWPPGHSRFKYRMSSDGFLRLQTVRYESVDVTEPSAANGDDNDVISAAVSAKSRKKKCIVTTSVTAPPPPHENGDDENGDNRSENGNKNGDSGGENSGEENRTDSRTEVDSSEPVPLSTDSTTPTPGKTSRKKKSSSAGTRPKSSGKRKSGGKKSDLAHVGERTGNNEMVSSNTDSDADMPTTCTAGNATITEDNNNDPKTSTGITGDGSKPTGKIRAKRGRPPTGTKTRKSGRRSGTKKNAAEDEGSGAELAEHSSEAAGAGINAADLQQSDPSTGIVHPSGSNRLEDVSANLSGDESALTAQSSRKRKRQSKSPTKRKRAALVRGNSLDECPPEIVELQWQAEPGTNSKPSESGGISSQLVQSHAGDGLHEKQLSNKLPSVATEASPDSLRSRLVQSQTGAWVWESQLANAQSSGAYSFRQRHAEQEASVQNVQGLSKEAYPVYENYHHSEESGPVEQTGEEQNAGANTVSMAGSSQLEALGLRVAEYGDSAEANLHMLGDVALTSLRVHKEKTRVVSSRRTRRK